MLYGEQENTGRDSFQYFCIIGIICLIIIGLILLPVIYFGFLNIGVTVLKNQQGYEEGKIPCPVYKFANQSLKYSYWGSLYESFLISVVIIGTLIVCGTIGCCCCVSLFEKLAERKSLRKIGDQFCHLY